MSYPAPPPPTPRCRTCRVPAWREFVDERFRQGLTPDLVARQCEEENPPIPLSKFSIEKHFRRHARAYVAIQVAAAGAKGKDLAIIVRDKTREAVVRGKLRPTEGNWRNVTMGLQAQALLDRREQKADELKTAMAVALLLSGSPLAGIAGPPDRLLIGEGEIVEGEVLEVG